MTDERRPEAEELVEDGTEAVRVDDEKTRAKPPIESDAPCCDHPDDCDRAAPKKAAPTEKTVPPTRPEPPKASSGVEGPLSWLVMAFCALASLVGLVLLFTSGTPVPAVDGGADGQFGLGSLLSKSGVAVVDIDGVIVFESSSSGLMGSSSRGAARTVRLLQKLRKEDKVKAVVLRINSPGGTVAASQEICQQVKALVAEGKPVVASMADVAASGGYYVAAPASYIFANGGTITGSIGVITSLMKFEPLVEKIGVNWEVYKSGELKDMGAGYRPSSEKEKKVFHEMIMGAYEQFVDVVAEGRIIKEELDSGRKPVLKTRDEVKAVADGRIFMGQKALEAGLVDELGGFYDALAKAGKLCGLGPEPHVIHTTPRGGLAKFMEMMEEQASTNVLTRLGLPRPDASPVLYLWRP